MNVTNVSVSNAELNRDETAQSKALKAGWQFEAILLNMVFGDLQRAFSQVPGAKENAIAKSYDGFGMEALTSGLAQSGGIGLSAFIGRALLAHAKEGPNGI